MLTKDKGATLAALVEATGWLPHTTRAAMTGLRKRGFAIERTRHEKLGSLYRIVVRTGIQGGCLDANRQSILWSCAISSTKELVRAKLPGVSRLAVPPSIEFSNCKVYFGWTSESALLTPGARIQYGMIKTAQLAISGGGSA